MPLTDGIEPPEPLAPWQADEPGTDDVEPLEPRCWCGRLLDAIVVTELYIDGERQTFVGKDKVCPIHGHA